MSHNPEEDLITETSTALQHISRKNSKKNYFSNFISFKFHPYKDTSDKKADMSWRENMGEGGWDESEKLLHFHIQIHNIQLCL